MPLGLSHSSAPLVSVMGSGWSDWKVGIPPHPAPSLQAVSTCAGQKRLCACARTLAYTLTRRDVENMDVAPRLSSLGSARAAAVFPPLSGSGRETETDDWLPPLTSQEVSAAAWHRIGCE